MSTGYTVGGDTLQDIGRQYYAAQSFVSSESFTLHFIDINLRTVHPTRSPDIKVYLADANHKPVGTFLSDTIRCWAENWNLYSVFRMRADMTPFRILAGVEYVIVVHAFAVDASYYLQWQYDKGDATYPYGIRLISTDGGSTWAERPNDDHIFYIFGTPPVPPPPPEPPIDNVAPLDFTQARTETGEHITLITNTPSHLYLYWTDIPPRKHKTPILRRGIQVREATRYCFVSFTQKEQLQEGDTLVHSFFIEPWPFCEERSFTFRATVNGAWSPSTGPIFTKHPKAQEYKLVVVEPWTRFIEPQPDYQFLLLERWTS